jgi:hypothetical protein
MNKRIFSIIRIVAAVFVAMIFINIPLQTSAATVKKKKLTQDTESYTFSNSSDGSFSYEYAKNEDYYKGSAVDESTGIKYALISWQDKIYAVVMTKKHGYNGSYDTTALTELSSQSYNPVTTKTVIKINKNKTGNDLLENGFFYDDDFAIITTGWSSGIYYVNGKKADGVHLIEDTYCYFSKGKQITKKGWYQYGKSYIYVSMTHVKYKFNGVNCYKYAGNSKKKVTNSFVDVNGIIYRFDKKGALAQGFYNIKEDYYYFKDGLYRTNFLKTVSDATYYFGNDGKAVKDTWVDVKNTVRYFSGDAANTKVYYATDYGDSSKAGKLKIKKNGKWSYCDTGIYNVNNTLVYIKNGVTCTSSCWYVAENGYKYYIKNGTIIYRLKEDNNSYSLKVREGNKWKKACSVWTPARKGIQLYFNAQGNIACKYFTSKYSTSAYRKTVWKYNSTKDKWTKIKNKVIKVDGAYYCASDKGTFVETEGWYTFSETSAAYIDSKGRVTEYVYYDEDKGCSVYKSGINLSKPEAGVYTVQIDGKQVYYLVDSSGIAVSGNQVYGNYIYQFDSYGRAYSRRLDGVVNWIAQNWLDRLTLEYIGVTDIDCNVFVDRALAYAGDDDSTIKMSVRFQDSKKGGIIVSDGVTCTQWGGGSVIGKAVLSDGTDWLEQTDVLLNENVVDFSYDELDPGDLIIYYKDGESEASHMSIYLGRFVSADAVKNYLKTIGVSKKLRDACVKDWGKYYDNDGTYWCIHGGMGSSRQVYISNSCYSIPSGSTYTYGKKIVNLFE